MRSPEAREVEAVLTIDWSFDEAARAPIHQDEMLSILKNVLAHDGVCRPCFVSVSIVDDDAMRSANATWRGIDAPTDVISLECEHPDDPGLAADEPCELGDILLAPAHIERQSADFGTTPSDEFRIMLVHGMLHLLGYDHLDEKEAGLMESAENEILMQIETNAPALTVEFTRHDEDGEDA